MTNTVLVAYKHTDYSTQHYHIKTKIGAIVDFNTAINLNLSPEKKTIDQLALSKETASIIKFYVWEHLYVETCNESIQVNQKCIYFWSIIQPMQNMACAW